MPRVGPLSHAETQNREIEGVILKYLNIRGITRTQLFKQAGIKRGTYYLRLNDTDDFKVGELKNIYRVLNVPKEERLQL
ncbi:MAG: hypothetical protein PHP50_14275 [Lachnospiraceae bacterium]|nr:hypothetical protein [Lachnospiraceae bacterium]